MAPKIAVVTGANKGIGYAIVKGLCEKFSGTVYLTARDVKKGEAAVEKLKSLGFHPVFYQLDVTDLNSINKLKNHISEKHGGLDLLVNNAAIAFWPDSKETLSQQAEKTVSVNYFGVLNVIEVLSSLLRKDARVVNISSSAGHLSRIPSEDLRKKFADPSLTVAGLNNLINKYVKDAKDGKQAQEGWGSPGGWSAYIVSKVGVSALTIILQREFDKEEPSRNISVNSVHPGYVNTDLNNHSGTLTIEEGAKAPLYLALDSHTLKGQFVWYDSTVKDWYADSMKWT